jgi:hypothetical protein
MTELENTIDIDCFNDEQRPNNLDYDCLEFGEHLMNSWKIDTSDEDYERYRDEQAERTEDAYREKMESMFEYFIS